MAAKETAAHNLKAVNAAKSRREAAKSRRESHSGDDRPSPATGRGGHADREQSAGGQATALEEQHMEREVRGAQSTSPTATTPADGAPSVAFGGELLRCVKNNGTELCIEEMGLTELPTSGYPETLTRLDASANELSHVPADLAHLITELRALDVSKNGLRSLPASLSECTELQTLRASHNGLRSLEFLPCPLQRLTELHADSNSLAELPRCLWACPRLKHVSLCANRLDVASLAMPVGATATGGPGLAPLEHLDLGKNRLGALPPLGLFPSLREVHLQQNGLRELPVAQITPLLQLQTLDISMNDVSNLPPDLARLPLLQHLTIAGNPIRSIPRGVQESGSTAVIDLLRKRLPVEVEA
jgi:Leucine-rich repeat (LRR) protein